MPCASRVTSETTHSLLTFIPTRKKMKVTLLVAVCTLVVLLQQTQTPMAKPQQAPLSFDPPYKPKLSEFLKTYPQHENSSADVDTTNHLQFIP